MQKKSVVEELGGGIVRNGDIEAYYYPFGLGWQVTLYQENSLDPLLELKGAETNIEAKQAAEVLVKIYD